jgi:hypothetical protein
MKRDEKTMRQASSQLLLLLLLLLLSPEISFDADDHGATLSSSKAYHSERKDSPCFSLDLVFLSFARRRRIFSTSMC